MPNRRDFLLASLALVKGGKAGDNVVVSWMDNKGEKNSAEATIG